MSIKNLLGLEEASITEDQIMERFCDAYNHNLEEVEFSLPSGKKVIIRLPHIDFNKHIDPWDKISR